MICSYYSLWFLVWKKFRIPNIFLTDRGPQVLFDGVWMKRNLKNGLHSCSFMSLKAGDVYLRENQERYQTMNKDDCWQKIIRFLAFISISCEFAHFCLKASNFLTHNAGQVHGSEYSNSGRPSYQLWLLLALYKGLTIHSITIYLNITNLNLLSNTI